MVKKSKPEVMNIDVSVGQTINISDLPSAVVPYPPYKYKGKILRIRNSHISMAICVLSHSEFIYEDNDLIGISFMEMQNLYIFNARISRSRPLDEEYDDFTIEDMGTEVSPEYGYTLHYIDIVALTEPVRQQRREYFRVPLSIDIYYKDIDKYDYEKINEIKMRLSPDDISEYRRQLADGRLENERGYEKIKTADISAGGYRFFSQKQFEEDSYIDCLLLLDNEMLPIITKIIGSFPSEEKNGFYVMRCCFHNVSDVIRDRLIKYIFTQQRLMQNKFIKHKN